jgi:hypothetical protein
VKRSVALSVALVVGIVAAGCSRSSSKPPSTTAAAAPSGSTSTTAANQCANVTLQATDIGITPTDITVEVMADVGSPLAPGLFQGNIDAIEAFANYVNAHGGIACRQLKVRTWDSKIDAAETKNGLIDACANAFSLLGDNALFNSDVSPMTNCVDKNGQATGLPDVAGLVNTLAEQCAPTAFVIQGRPEHCQTTSGVRPLTVAIGNDNYWVQQNPGLHGIYLVAGDLPETTASGAIGIDAGTKAGITWDATPKVSGADAQPAYTPRVEAAKAKGSTFVYDGSNDVAMVRMRKESVAQGVTTVKVWACSLACYTNAFIPQGGADVEGTQLAIPFLPFEEATLNPTEQAFITALGSKVTSWGAQAWQAGLAFQQAIDNVVAKSGPNAVTRASLLSALKGLTDFTANGWLGPQPTPLVPGQISPCYVMMQVQNGKFVRLYPSKPGTFDCTPSNITTLMIDPAAEAAKLK